MPAGSSGPPGNRSTLPHSATRQGTTPTTEAMNGASNSAHTLGNFTVDEPRPMKVVVIGAGYSGIIAGIRFRQHLKNTDLTIYESHAGVGGTWYANRYPGLACDIPSHSYQVGFELNPNWSAFYSPGPEIHNYLESIVEKHKLWPLIKLQHRLVKAEYDEGAGKWNLTIRRARRALTRDERLQSPDGKGPLKVPTYDDDRYWETVHDSADVLFMAVGCLTRWSWPDIRGLETFEGIVVHSAQWDMVGKEDDKTWQDTVVGWDEKRVGVIGSGSSAIQMVPALQPKVKHLFNYVRGKTWISTSFSRDLLVAFSGGKEVGNYLFTEEDKIAFQDADRYLKLRQEMERVSQLAHRALVNNDPVAAEARSTFEAQMREKLAKKPWICDHRCRRVTPGPGYLEALCEDNVDFVPSPIREVKHNGIETVNGEFQELDVIVCATGFDTSYQPDFTVIGRGGRDLKAHYNPHPRTYLSMAVDGFPNMFHALGPNSAHGAGNLIIIIEAQVDYAIKAIQKMQRERIKSMEAKTAAVDDFERHIDSYFPTTAFGTKCRSWYKAGKEEGRVVAIWPGSPLHIIKTLEHPRWEDYDYEYVDDKGRLYWLGNGYTVADIDPTADIVWYLDPKLIDHPPIPN